jgi:hypothetical protein
VFSSPTRYILSGCFALELFPKFSTQDWKGLRALQIFDKRFNDSGKSINSHEKFLKFLGILLRLHKLSFNWFSQ